MNQYLFVLSLLGIPVCFFIGVWVGINFYTKEEKKKPPKDTTHGYGIFHHE